ncbi:hypothetical protein U1Q18_040247 [Sarracenia purpurea var. burkii]
MMFEASPAITFCGRLRRFQATSTTFVSRSLSRKDQLKGDTPPGVILLKNHSGPTATRRVGSNDYNRSELSSSSFFLIKPREEECLHECQGTS